MIQNPNILGSLFDVYDKKEHFLQELFLGKNEEIQYLIIKFLNYNKKRVKGEILLIHSSNT